MDMTNKKYCDDCSGNSYPLGEYCGGCKMTEYRREKLTKIEVVNEPIYEKEIKCVLHLVISKIEDELYYIASAGMMRECENFEERTRNGEKITNEDHGKLPIKIMIRIEEDK